MVFSWNSTPNTQNDSTISFYALINYNIMQYIKIKLFFKMLPFCYITAIYQNGFFLRIIMDFIYVYHLML